MRCYLSFRSRFSLLTVALALGCHAIAAEIPRAAQAG